MAEETTAAVQNNQIISSGNASSTGSAAKTVKSQSAMEYLTTYGWAVLVIAIVLGTLFSLGLFSPSTFINTTCVFPSEFGCLSAILFSTNSTLLLNLQQSSASNINVTALGCNNQGVIANMIKPLNIPSNQILMTIGSNYTFSLYCYQNGSVVNLQPGQVFKGYLLVNYTYLQTNFPHTVIATLIAKAV